MFKLAMLRDHSSLLFFNMNTSHSAEIFPVLKIPYLFNSIYVYLWYSHSQIIITASMKSNILLAHKFILVIWYTHSWARDAEHK